MFYPTHCMTRRQVLETAACGFGSLALAGLCAQQAAGGRIDPLAPREPHFTPRAKRVIFLFMQGGPSQVDTFDYKPALEQQAGKVHDFRDSRVDANPMVGAGRVGPVMPSPWKFAQHGQSGLWVSELFPHLARRVDDLCVIHSMHTEGIAHAPATLFLHTGANNFVRPSIGAWIGYGLGTENENLPAFITVNPPMANGGPRNYAHAFLPAAYQGAPIGRAGVPAKQSKIRNLTNARRTPEEQRRQLDLLQRLNQEQLERRPAGEKDELEAVIGSFELAYRMQTHAPGVTDLSGESAATLRMYGVDEKASEDFGRQCLLARRLAEAGVRYIQVNYADNSNNPRWDQHSNLPRHADHARATDQPVAGLLQDLKQRGLLEDTLVWWGGEFGRNPYAEGAKGTGRDHNPNGFTIWLAGGGVKHGLAYGATDEFGHRAVHRRVHMHDLHATVLHLLGLDHQRLTYRHAGRNFRLTDVHGRVAHEIMA